jgi:hypothetical protein
MSMERLPLVVVQWTDAYSYRARPMTLAAWRQEVTEIDEIHWVAGYLVVDNEKEVVVAQNVASDSVDCLFSIPRNMVLSTEYTGRHVETASND